METAIIVILALAAMAVSTYIAVALSAEVLYGYVG